MRVISLKTAKEIDKLHLSVILDKTNNSDNFYYSSKGYLDWVDVCGDYYIKDKIYSETTESYLIPACRLDELFEFLLNRNIFVCIKMTDGKYSYRIYVDKIEMSRDSSCLKKDYYNCLEEGLREALKYL